MHIGGVVLHDVALWYGVFSSPYYPHRNGYAVDMYFEDEALFPFLEGLVLEVRSIDTPMNRPDAEKEDFLIIVWLGGPYVVKILHVKPSVKPFERIYLGDCLGRLALSGYLPPWGERHMHIEVRPIFDRYRVRNGLRIKLVLLRRDVASANIVDRLLAEVVDMTRSFALLRPVEPDTYGITPLHVDKEYIEGVVPLYGYYSIYSTNRGVLDLGTFRASTVTVARETGRIADDRRNTYKGIGAYVLRPYIKLILHPNKTYDLRVGDVVELYLNELLH